MASSAKPRNWATALIHRWKSRKDGHWNEFAICSLIFYFQIRLLCKLRANGLKNQKLNYIDSILCPLLDWLIDILVVVEEGPGMYSYLFLTDVLTFSTKRFFKKNFRGFFNLQKFARWGSCAATDPWVKFLQIEYLSFCQFLTYWLCFS